MPQLQLQQYCVSFQQALQLQFTQPPPWPPPATFPDPPLASAMAVPPSAVTPIVVVLETLPPSIHTEPYVFPTEMMLPTLPPVLTSPMTTVPPVALAVPPLPAVSWAASRLGPSPASAAPSIPPNTQRREVPMPQTLASWSKRSASIRCPPS